ncbi:MAG: FKBP-type peptidyl-prolyl cis-trans isomerase FkpA [Cyclobacteriaceae bacterium]|jgi:FKBP-type peptidyl-prolyl cis-trans isomerase FkpA
MKHLFYTLLFSLILFISCKDEEVDFITSNDIEIMAYITEQKLDAQKSETGLYYVIDNPGTGAQPTFSSDVTVRYKGYFLDGTVFDESDSNGTSFNLLQVISGWTEGITYFKQGGNGILLVPAHLGYGNNDYRGIPGGSVLAFDITLIKVK